MVSTEMDRIEELMEKMTVTNLLMEISGDNLNNFITNWKHEMWREIERVAKESEDDLK